MFSLSGKYAVVTGGGSGIGAAICECFAAVGASVCVIDREPAGANAVVERINSAGPVTKVFLLASDFGLGLNVEVSAERSHELALKTGDTVFVSPRKVRVFVPEYVI